MTNPAKPRVRVAANSTPFDNVRQIMQKAIDDVQDAVDVDGTHMGTGSFQDQLRTFTAPTSAPTHMSGTGVSMTGHSDMAASPFGGLAAIYERIAGAWNNSEAAAKAHSHRQDFLTSTAWISAKLGERAVSKSMSDLAVQEDQAFREERKAKLLDIAETLKSALQLITKAENEGEGDEGVEENEEMTKAIKAIKSLQKRVAKELLKADQSDTRQHGPDWQSLEVQDDLAGERQTAKSLSLTDVFAHLMNGNGTLQSPPDPARFTAMKAQATGDYEGDLSMEDQMELATYRQRLQLVGKVDGFTREKAGYGISPATIARAGR